MTLVQFDTGCAGHDGGTRRFARRQQRWLLVMISGCLGGGAASQASAPGSCDPTQTQKLLASDGGTGDGFGYAVAAEGGTLVVGSYLDTNAGGVASGAAYVFVNGTGSWVEQTKLLGSNLGSGDHLGISVGISGDSAIAGAHRNDFVAGNAGSAHVFVRAGGIWTEQAMLLAADAALSDEFGVSVAIDGDTALVGAGGDNHAGGVDAGSAYVFVRNGTVWTQQQRLSASDAGAFDFFGTSVALSGDTAIIGAPFEDNAGSQSGSAYVFVRAGGVWTQQQKLIAPDAASNDYFGEAVALSGNCAIIGSARDDDACPQLTNCNSGSAYVWVRNGSLWTVEQKLTASDADTGDFFGYSVAIDGDFVVVGAQLSGVNFAGSAYLFHRVAGLWQEQGMLTASDAGNIDQLGISVAVTMDTAFAGADLDDNEGGTDAGSVYVYGFTCGTVPGDINGDGLVNGIDLALILGSWGPCPGCPADLNGDLVVDGADLAIVLGYWSPIPPPPA